MAKRRLTDRQKARIAAIQEKRRQRMAARAEASLDQGQPDTTRHGRIITRHGQNLVVADEQLKFVHCLFRQNLGDLVCGDEVIWQATGDTEGVVTARQPRRSVLSRPDYSGRDKPIAANIDQLLLVIAPRPEPGGFLVDQYLVAAELAGVQAGLVINKMDLLSPTERDEFLARFGHYEQIGYPLIPISAKQPDTLSGLYPRLNDRTNILVGQSGVGKSSLIRTLLPDQDIQVGRLSEATGLGRHTTSATTLYRLPNGGELIDSPGVRSFRLGNIQRQELENGFREFLPHLGHCRFANCQHDREPGCALQAATESGAIHPHRLASFHQMVARLAPDF